MAQNIGTGTAGQVAADIINKGFVAPIVQQIDDLIHLDRNHQRLQSNLKRMENVLQHISNGFEQQKKTPADSITYCMERARHAIVEAERLIGESGGEQSSILSKPKISREVRQLNMKFDQLFPELLRDFSLFLAVQQIVVVTPPQSSGSPQSLPIGQSSASAPPQEKNVFLQTVPDGGFVGSGIESAGTQLQSWITADQAPQVRMIGVYGMAGVGKTSLLKRVYNLYKVSDVFDVVIWLTVSRDYKIYDLQGQIAEAIDLDLLSTSNIDTRKMKLSASLKLKKFLLILDDIWSSINLDEELGVAFGDDNVSKVVFSTRNRELASMDAHKSLKMKPLSTEEGWELFQRVAFVDGHVPEEIMECARKIADECAGLPLAITVVAAAMRGKTPVADEWNTSLSMMKIADPCFPDTHPRVDKQLYQKLRWSYDDLAQTPNLQNCFLYCAMYPEDEKIWVEELVRMWIAEGFLKSKTCSIDMQLGHRYVKLLIDRGLFQSVNLEKQGRDIIANKPVKVWKKRFIKVHDVIHDMAIHIGEKEEKYLCRAGLQRKDFPPTETQDCKRMSLRSNQVESLPEDFLSTQLVSLFLSKNPLTYNVRGGFLINLTSLRVLDLSNTQIESVPTASLTQLRVLDLSNTKIESVPTSLIHLQFLTLRCTCIKELPKDIGKLSNLQFLDVSECKYLTSLPTEISQLTSLRRLHLNMGMENAVKDPTNVMALTGLKNLTELHLFMFFKFETHEKMGTIMGSWVEMRHLYLHHNHMNYVKCNLPQGMQNMKNLQSLVLFDYRGTNLPNWICEFQQLERLELDACDNVKQIPPLEKLPNLKFLKLRNYSNVRDLGIGSFGTASGFPKLEMLHLSEMSKLRSIGALEEGTLSKLRVLKIKKCPLLRKLPMGMEKLSNLRAVYGHRIGWWEKLIWEDHNMKTCLHKLFKEI